MTQMNLYKNVHRFNWKTNKLVSHIPRRDRLLIRFGHRTERQEALKVFAVLHRSFR